MAVFTVGLLVLLLLGGGLCLLTLREVMVLRHSPESYSLKDKLRFCLLYSYIASGLIYALLRIAGLDISWLYQFLVMPVPMLIYYSVMRAFIPYQGEEDAARSTNPDDSAEINSASSRNDS
ncbi:hypothetical protein QQM79_12370 [Marinobacteraceae bacterium S3BR75-40.1]